MSEVNTIMTSTLIPEIQIVKPEILIVDDTLEQLQLIKKILEDEGYKLRLANSGQVALNSVELKKPDLILLDIQMPEMDGYQVCKILKSKDETKEIPVIFLSAMKDVQDKVKGFEAGGIDYITKPYEALEVLERIKSHLRIFYMRQRLVTHNQELEIEIGKQKENTKELLLEGELLRTTVLSIGDGVICTDRTGNVVLINEVAKNLTGWYEDNAMGRDFEEICYIIDFNTRMRIESPIPNIVKTGKTFYLTQQYSLISRDGIERLISDSIAPIWNGAKEIIGTVMVFRDSIDETVRKNQLDELIYKDQLTGIRNRRFFEEELMRINSEECLPLSIILGDINGLKMTNDAFGHGAGDIQLRHAAQVLQQFTGPQDIVCRFGGDEFAIILPKTTEKQAESYINAVQKTLESVDMDKNYFSMAFGTKTKTKLEETNFSILKDAEDNMFKNKMLESPSIRHEMIQTIMNTLFEKSPRERAHSERVSEIVQIMGKAMKLSKLEINTLKTAGLLHDIGKTIISDQTLNKPGKLDTMEWEEMKRHPEIGYRILRNISELSEVADIILQHHERWDGSGYPRGFSKDKINLLARLVSIADSFDAMTSARSYKNDLPFQEAIEELRRKAGTQFDPEIVEIFVKCIEG